MEKVKIKYVGSGKLYFSMPLFSGIIEKGDVIETTKECYDKELNKDYRWKLESKPKQKKEVKAND